MVAADVKGIFMLSGLLLSAHNVIKWYSKGLTCQKTDNM